MYIADTCEATYVCMYAYKIICIYSYMHVRRHMYVCTYIPTLHICMHLYMYMNVWIKYT